MPCNSKTGNWIARVLVRRVMSPSEGNLHGRDTKTRCIDTPRGFYRSIGDLIDRGLVRRRLGIEFWPSSGGIGPNRVEESEDLLTEQCEKQGTAHDFGKRVNHAREVPDCSRAPESHQQ